MSDYLEIEHLRAKVEYQEATIRSLSVDKGQLYAEKAGLIAEVAEAEAENAKLQAVVDEAGHAVNAIVKPKDPAQAHAYESLCVALGAYYNKPVSDEEERAIDAAFKGDE